VLAILLALGSPWHENCVLASAITFAEPLASGG